MSGETLKVIEVTPAHVKAARRAAVQGIKKLREDEDVYGGISALRLVLAHLGVYVDEDGDEEDLEEADRSNARPMMAAVPGLPPKDV